MIVWARRDRVGFGRANACTCQCCLWDAAQRGAVVNPLGLESRRAHPQPSIIINLWVCVLLSLRRVELCIGDPTRGVWR